MWTKPCFYTNPCGLEDPQLFWNTCPTKVAKVPACRLFYLASQHVLDDYHPLSIITIIISYQYPSSTITKPSSILKNGHSHALTISKPSFACPCHPRCWACWPSASQAGLSRRLQMARVRKPWLVADMGLEGVYQPPRSFGSVFSTEAY